MKRCFACLIVALGFLAGCGEKKPTAVVEFSYEQQPSTPLPDQYMSIAVRNARVECDDGEFDQKKWSEMTADLLQGSLEEAKEKHNIPLKLVDREHLKLAAEEQDLAAAGVTDSGDAVGSAQIVGASAVITSKVTIKVDKQKGKAKTIDAMSVVAGRWGGGGGVSASDEEKESRNIVVQCQFQLKAAGNNDIIASHTGKPVQHYDKARRPSPFFGSSKTEADMTPRDKVIGQMIEDQAAAFLAKFVPVRVAASCTVKPSSHQQSIAGVKCLVIDDYETALADFKTALSEDSNDHQSMFGAGVCCEKLKRMDEALKYYKMARSLKMDDPQYAVAVERLSSFAS